MMITFQTYIPKTINHLVKSLWYMEVDINGPFYDEQIIPDGHHEIIFYLDSNCSKRQNSSGNWVDEPKALVAGQTLKSYNLRMQKGARLFGIRFYPHTLYHFCKVPLNLVNAGVMPLSDLMDTGGFWNSITDDPHQTFKNIERYLFEASSPETLNSQGYQYVDYALNYILKSNGILPIHNFIQKSGISAKYYDDLFKKYAGITPKVLCNILKFNNFISYRVNYPEKNLTECAYAAGYYDQSHLIKSFRQFTDSTPGKYFEAENQISDLFSAL